MNEPRDNDRAPDDATPPGPSLGESGPRPDWLVSAEDGVEAEAARLRERERTPVIRPGDVPPRPEVVAPPPRVPAPSVAAPAAPVEQAHMNRPVAAEASGLSHGFEYSAPEQPYRDAPEERVAPAPAAAAPAYKQAADAPWLEPEHEVQRKPKSRYIVTNGEPAAAAPAVSRSMPIGSPLVKWGGLALGLMLILFVGLRSIPKKDDAQTTRINDIQKAPESFDGHTVTVSGRVGERFAIGESWAYYLHDGDHMLLVFTRKDAPETARHTATGTISMGQYEGATRVSLFERAN